MPVATSSAARVVVIAGEVSGDHQGRGLIAALRRARPDLSVSAVGGPEMAAAGADVLVDSTRWGVIGYAEAYVRLPVFAARFWRIVRLVERVRPDLLLLIDFPGMNREVVARFSGRLPIAYFFPPQTYGRRGTSAIRMARAAVRLLAVFPFEAEAYRRAGADVVYVGHPAVDAADRASARREAVRAEWGAGGATVLGLLPGSRAQEVRSLLAPMLDAARELGRRRPVRCVLPLAAPFLHSEVASAIARSGVDVRVVDGRALDVMAAADAIVVASGTAPVEAACVGVPMVVVYRVSAITEWIARRFVLTPEVGSAGFSTPSIVLGRPVVPELLQRAVTGPRIYDELSRLFDGGAERQRVDLAAVRERLGPAGVLNRVAAEVLGMLDRRAEATIR
ncbi:MAG TPA: lipid-A-disaccharide synthase [bacterium]|nr:lipid-A-disaccharide synthase [bacterium]